MKLFNRTGKAEKKWRRKAWMIDSHKTKIILGTASSKPKHVPPWIFRRLNPQIKERYALSNVRMEYCSPVGCPINNAVENSDEIKEVLPF